MERVGREGALQMEGQPASAAAVGVHTVAGAHASTAAAPTGTAEVAGVALRCVRAHRGYGGGTRGTRRAVAARAGGSPVPNDGRLSAAHRPIPDRDRLFVCW